MQFYLTADDASKLLASRRRTGERASDGRALSGNASASGDRAYVVELSGWKIRRTPIALTILCGAGADATEA